MNKPKTPTCNIRAPRIGPWFWLTTEVKIPKQLQTKDHARFRFDLDFAGFSTGGKPLSHKESAGPAKIGAIPLLPTKPEGWQDLPRFSHVPLPLQSATPRLAFHGIANNNRDRDVTLCIHPDDLAPIVEISQVVLLLKDCDLNIDELTPATANLLGLQFRHLKMVFHGHSVFVRVPNTLRLNRGDWAILNRHMFTGALCGTLLDTVSTDFSRRSSLYWRCAESEHIKLLGSSTDEVNARWGVEVSTPCGYDGTHLYFDTLQVVDGQKLSKLCHNAELLKGRRITFSRQCGRLGLSLRKAFDADVVPNRGVLSVDPTMEIVWLHGDKFKVADLLCPVELSSEFQDEPTLLCPENMVSQFLMPVRQAANAFVVPSDVKAFRVRAHSASETSSDDPPGRYYLLTDLQDLPLRDRKREREVLSARHTKLIASYGTELPANWAKLTDEQIAHYFEIQDLVQSGEFTLAESHPLVHRDEWKSREILDWIRQKASHLVKTCPVTNQLYLRRLKGFEELVDIPGFWKTIESTVGDGAWLRRLISCPQVQAAALIESI